MASKPWELTDNWERYIRRSVNTSCEVEFYDETN